MAKASEVRETSSERDELRVRRPWPRVQIELDAHNQPYLARYLHTETAKPAELSDEVLRLANALMCLRLPKSPAKRPEESSPEESSRP